MTEADVATAALQEVGVSTGVRTGDNTLSFTFPDLMTASPVVYWRACCIARLSTRRQPETFDAWRQRHKAKKKNQRSIYYQQLCAWLDSVEAPDT